MQSWQPHAALVFVSILCLVHAAAPCLHAEQTMHVDGTKGDDKYFGDAQMPLKSLSAALAKLKDPLT